MTTSPIETTSVSTSYRRSLHVIACLTAIMIFPLVIVGAGVTSKEAGMAYPDWPTSDGHYVNPPGWFDQVATRWEHGHRLIGWVVGMFAIVLVFFTWGCGGYVRWLGLGTLVAICVQGVMGGVRVVEISTLWAMVHGIWGQICFCLASVTALVVSRSWQEPAKMIPIVGANLLQKLCAFTSFAIFIQLSLGGGLRHFNCQYSLVLHLLWAVVVAMLIGWIVMWVIGLQRSGELIQKMGWILGLLMVLQLILGGFALIVTVMGGLQSDLLIWAIPSVHVAVGALLLVSSVLLTLLSYRRLTHVNPRTTSIQNTTVAT